MSDTEPAAVVGAVLAALERRDDDAVVARTAEDVAIQGPRGTGHGHDLLRAWLGRTGLALAAERWFVRDGTVVVWGTATFRAGEAAGTSVPSALLAEVRGERVVLLGRTDTLDEALARSGLTDADELE